jgi:hypothetical protein
MRESGIDNFEFIPIEYFSSREEMNAAEKAEVARIDAKNPRIGYNSVAGGGCVGSEAGIKAAKKRAANRAAAFATEVRSPSVLDQISDRQSAADVRNLSTDSGRARLRQ